MTLARLCCSHSQEYRVYILSLCVNQKLGLCHALLELGDWAGAYDLIKLLPPFLPVWCPAIVKVLCELVTISIEPLYRRYAFKLISFNVTFLFFLWVSSYSPRAAKGLPRSSSPPPSSLLIKPCSSLLDLYPCVFEMLYCLGPHMHSDPILLAKMMRLGRSFMKDSKSSRSAEEQPERVSSWIKKVSCALTFSVGEGFSRVYLCPG